MNAISLASSIVQFAQLGTKLVLEGLELYQSNDGALAENRELETIVNDINQRSKILINTPQPSEDEVALQKLAQSSGKIADELLEQLSTLRIPVSHKRLQSSRKALAAAWKKDKIVDLERRLARLQNQINQRLVFMMSNQQSSIVSTLKILGNKDLNEMKSEILSAIQQSRSRKPPENASDDLPGRLETLAAKVKSLSKEQHILSGLHFWAMKMREASISEAHERTFEWIFEDQPVSGAQVKLKEWLNHGNGIYWIAGKAGSGRSTLMKYLVSEPRTESNLQAWAGNEALVIAKFFFWNAGNDMQKSQEGLLQSLLHEVLGQRPQLIESVCPSRWRSCDLYDTYSEPWTRQELIESFDLLSRVPNLTSKFCFFIDGLDEYQGDHFGLIQTMRRLAASSSIKICLSSRPWEEFTDAFGRDKDRTITLQELTRRDIQLYVHDALKQHPHFAKLEEADPRWNELVEELEDRAQGVFLWVTIVVRSLLRGLTHADDVTDLQRRLREFPAELNPFFQHIFDSIDPFYREQTAQLFLVNIEALTPPSVIALQFIEEERRRPDYIFELNIKPYSDKEIEDIYGTVKRRLNARCKDLLEVNVEPYSHPFCGYRVGFLHRTVRDYLIAPQMREMLNGWATKEFDVTSSLCRAHLAQIMSLPWPREATQRPSVVKEFFRLVNGFMYYASKLEHEKGLSDVALINALDHAASSFWERRNDVSELSFYSSSPKLGVLHWTNLELSVKRRDDSERREKTFLAKTVECGLRLYVTAVLDAQPQLLRAKRGRSLLDYALRPRVVERYCRVIGSVDPDMVRLLLLRGADPNQMIRIYNTKKSDRITVRAIFLWKIWLDAKFWEYSPENPRWIEELFAVTEMLLKRGANLDLQLKHLCFQEESIRGNALRPLAKLATPVEILHAMFPCSHTAALEALLAKRRPSALKKWFGKTTQEVDISQWSSLNRPTFGKPVFLGP